MLSIFVSKTIISVVGEGELSRTKWPFLNLLGRLAAPRHLADQLEVVHLDVSQARDFLSGLLERTVHATLQRLFTRRFEGSDGAAVPRGFVTTGVSLSPMEIRGEGLL